MNTAIYIRVSTEEQASEGFSIHAQKDKLTKYAEINDWNIVDYYVDDGISGKNLDERPQVQRLLNDIRDSKIKNILVYKLDRLTRSVKDLIYLIEYFDKYGCTFNSQTEHIDTSSAVGRMFIKIIGIFAEFERENLAERITFGYEQKTKEGNYTNCNGVFGYDYIKGDGVLIINEYEAYYVKKIYEWFLNGNSMFYIAKKLTNANVATKRGGKWRQSTISSILNNPLYIGIVRYGVLKKNGFNVDSDKVEPIISKELFYSVNKLIKHRKKYNNRNNSSNDTYFNTVLKCFNCGKKMSSIIQVKNGKKYISYKCMNCKSKSISHRKIENQFLKYLEKIDDFEYNEKIFNQYSNDIISKVLNLKKDYYYLDNDKKRNFFELFVSKIELLQEKNDIIIKKVAF